MKSLLLFLSLGFILNLQAQLCEETIFESCEQCYLVKIIEVDFDSDGDEDILLASRYKSNFIWFEQLPGGEYAAAKELFSGLDGIVDFVVSDFDKDGDYDLVYSAFHTSIKVERGIFFLENNTASFESPVEVSKQYYQRLELDDIDADGDTDLIAFSDTFYSSEYEIVAFENLTGTTFGEKKLVAPLSNINSSYSSADFNGDGLLDFLVTDPSSNIPSIVFAQSGGNYSDLFLLNDPYPEGVIESLSVRTPMDVDQDGDIDVLIEDSNYIQWYENLGEGDFTERKKLFEDFSPELPRARYWQLFDCDNDGQKDIVFVDADTDALIWSKNSGALLFEPLETLYQFDESLLNVSSQTSAGKKTNALYTFSANEQALYKLDFNQLENKKIGSIDARKFPRDAELIDFDGDGDNDVIALFGETTEVVYFQNEGNGSFVKEEVYDNIAPGPQCLLVGDLDNDADQDFLLISESHKLVKITSFLNDGNGNFSKNLWFSQNYTYYTPSQFKLVDVDNDETLELSFIFRTAIAFYKNNSDGTFDFHLSVPFSISRFQAIEFGDLNGDDLVDILSIDRALHPSNNSLSEFAIFYNQGNYAFERLDAITNLDTNSDKMLYADLDRDGLHDFVYSYGKNLVWHRNLGNDFFGESTLITIATASLNQLRAVDFDLDGDIDIIANSFSAGEAILVKNDGTGNFDEAETLIENHYSYFLEIGDVDNDQYSDLLSSHSFHGKISLFKNKPIHHLSSDGLEEVVVFPNPTGSEVFLEGLPEGNFSVSDAKGRRLFQSNFDQCGSIDLRNFPPGIYFIEVSNGEESTIRKVIKK